MCPSSLIAKSPPFYIVPKSYGLPSVVLLLTLSLTPENFRGCPSLDHTPGFCVNCSDMFCLGLLRLQYVHSFTSSAINYQQHQQQ